MPPRREPYSNKRKTDNIPKSVTEEQLLAKAEENISELGPQIGGYQDKIDTILQRTEEGMQVMEELKAENQKLKLQLSSTSNVNIQNLNYEVGRLNVILDKLRAHNEDLKERLEDKDRRIREHIETIKEKQALLNYCDKAMEVANKQTEEKDTIINALKRLIGGFEVVLASEQITIDKEGFTDLCKKYNPYYRQPYLEFVNKMVTLLNNFDEWRVSEDFKIMYNIMYDDDKVLHPTGVDMHLVRTFYLATIKMIEESRKLFIAPVSEKPIPPEELKLMIMEFVKEQPAEMVKRLDSELDSLLARVKNTKEIPEFAKKMDRAKPLIKTQEVESSNPVPTQTING